MTNRPWNLHDIKTGDTFWLSPSYETPRHCLARFDDINPDGFSRDFHCINGAWNGTLTEVSEDGSLELRVHVTGSRFRAYITEKSEGCGHE